ncbi:MAG TPA: DNRLRE domain-containing protein, partial [Anaerolineae bacterium]|nr:DNRLRE domain-containing protein [Anaerolineae bacterium]
MKRFLLAMSLLLGALLWFGRSASPPAHAASVRTKFSAVADTFVSQANPNANYGSRPILRIDAVPIVNTFLQFDIEGMTTPITHAWLRLYATHSSSEGYTVYAVQDNSWDESTVTYDSAPIIGEELGISGPFEADTWTRVDVTAAIVGNGMYSFAIRAADADSLTFPSSNAPMNSPKLVLWTEAPTPTPTLTPPTPETEA